MKRTTALVALLAGLSFGLPAAPVMAQGKDKKTMAKKSSADHKKPAHKTAKKRTKK